MSEEETFVSEIQDMLAVVIGCLDRIQDKLDVIVSETKEANSLTKRIFHVEEDKVKQEYVTAEQLMRHFARMGLPFSITSMERKLKELNIPYFNVSNKRIFNLEYVLYLFKKKLSDGHLDERGYFIPRLFENEPFNIKPRPRHSDCKERE